MSSRSTSEWTFSEPLCGLAALVFLQYVVPCQLHESVCFFAAMCLRAFTPTEVLTLVLTFDSV